MKGVVFVLAASLLVYSGCHTERLAAKEEKVYNETVELIQSYMVPGTELSAERPAPDLLSEQEVMIRAAQAMAREGYLDPAHRIYQEVPELATAKVAEPIFTYNANLLRQGVTAGMYEVYVVDDNGISLASTIVDAEQILESESEALHGISLLTVGTPQHLITKKEAVATFREAFPHQQVAEPIAVRIWDLEGVRYSNTYIFWYTTVTEAGRSAGEAAAEYLLCASVVSPPPGLNISANPRAALSHGAPAWGTRIARIDEPLHLHEKLAQAKARAAAGEPEPAVGPTPPVKITPVEF